MRLTSSQCKVILIQYHQIPRLALSTTPPLCTARRPPLPHGSDTGVSALPSSTSVPSVRDSEARCGKGIVIFDINIDTTRKIGLALHRVVSITVSHGAVFLVALLIWRKCRWRCRGHGRIPSGDWLRRDVFAWGLGSIHHCGGIAFRDRDGGRLFRLLLAPVVAEVAVPRGEVGAVRRGVVIDGRGIRWDGRGWSWGGGGWRWCNSCLTTAPKEIHKENLN